MFDMGELYDDLGQDLSENFIDNIHYEILFNEIKPTNIVKKVPIIKKFFESLKITFYQFWKKEDKKEWMKLIRIFSILDTHHLSNLIILYDQNVFLRYQNFNTYLSDLKKGYKTQNCGYFIVAIQHFLQQR